MLTSDSADSANDGNLQRNTSANTSANISADISTNGGTNISYSAPAHIDDCEAPLSWREERTPQEEETLSGVAGRLLDVMAGATLTDCFLAWN
jgi:hypothetical protein